MDNNATLALPGAGPGLPEIMHVVGGLLLILGVIFLAFYLLRRFGHKAGLPLFKRGLLQLESQLALGPRRSVVVVRFLNKRLVLGVTDHGINLLTETELDHDEHDHDSSGRPARTDPLGGLGLPEDKPGDASGGEPGLDDFGETLARLSKKKQDG